MKRISSVRQGGFAPKARAIAAALAALACVFALAFWLLPVMPRGMAEGGATVSDYAGMTREEIQEELDRQVAESMMTVTVSPRALVHGDGRVELVLANDAQNEMHQRFAVVQDGVAVYESGVVASGQGLSLLEARGLAPGRATVSVQGVDPETGKDAGSAANVEIEVVQAPDEQGL